MVAVLDANTLIQYVEKDHPRHAETVDLLASIEDDFVVAGVNLAEVLVGAVRADRGHAVLASIIDSLGAEIHDGRGAEWAMRVATLRAAVSPAISLPDAYCLATALVTQGSVVTFDASLRASSISRGVQVHPH
ncbi:MAG: PIN domain-containing protein, partial [Frankiaceae bacterium]|jgi:predicted nucleic acid-binding protein|nr:PIN domain-containing protein [Frankiaceae bacterium]